MNKICISKTLIREPRYIHLPSSAKAFYLDLNAECDDMGVVDIERVMRLTGAAIGDHQALVAGNLICMLNVPDAVIAYIVDWTSHNTGLEPRWLKPSIYLSALLTCRAARVFDRVVIATDKRNRSGAPIMKNKTIVVPVHTYCAHHYRELVDQGIVLPPLERIQALANRVGAYPLAE